jgi:hypothetical protein
LQLMERSFYRLLMCRDDPRVVTHQRGDGNRFGRREGEIVKTRRLAVSCATPSEPVVE